MTLDERGASGEKDQEVCQTTAIIILNSNKPSTFPLSKRTSAPNTIPTRLLKSSLPTLAVLIQPINQRLPLPSISQTLPPSLSHLPFPSPALKTTKIQTSLPPNVALSPPRDQLQTLPKRSSTLQRHQMVKEGRPLRCAQRPR
jgi:hypothetical protein